MIESINAITLGTHDMGQAVRFYQTLGFDVTYGGAEDEFTSFRVGTGYLNLTAQPVDRQWSWWGRAIFHVADVDALTVTPSPKDLNPTQSPETQNGANVTSTSQIRTVTNLALRVLSAL